MRFWHQAHFGLWNRSEWLARSDGWFIHTLPNATSAASYQGYAGARWPKMVAPVITKASPMAGRYMYVHVCACMCMYVHVCACMCMCICMHTAAESSAGPTAIGRTASSS